MHEFIEVGVTLCVLTARADKIAVEIDVIADDALDRAVRRAVGWGGRTVSESALTTRINATRTAVGDDGDQQRLIRTIPRKGIRFVGIVQERARGVWPNLDAD